MTRKTSIIIRKTVIYGMALCLIATCLPVGAMAEELPSGAMAMLASGISDADPFTILEVVPVEGSGSVGYYIPGQEPWMAEGATKATPEERKAYFDGITTLDDLAGAGLLGPFSATSYTDYSEMKPGEEGIPDDATEINLTDSSGGVRYEVASAAGIFTIATGAGSFAPYVAGQPAPTSGVGPQPIPDFGVSPISLIPPTGDYWYVGSGNGDYTFTPDPTAGESSVIYSSVFSLLPYENENWFRRYVVGDGSNSFAKSFPIQVNSIVADEVTQADVNSADLVILSSGYDPTDPTTPHVLGYTASVDLPIDVANTIYDKATMFDPMPVLMDMRVLGSGADNIKSVMTRLMNILGISDTTKGFLAKNVLGYNENYITADYNNPLDNSLYSSSAQGISMAMATRYAMEYATAQTVRPPEVTFGSYGGDEVSYLYLPNHPSADGGSDTLLVDEQDIVFWFENKNAVEGRVTLEFYYQNPNGDYEYEYDPIKRTGIIKAADSDTDTDDKYAKMELSELGITPDIAGGLSQHTDYSFGVPSQIINRLKNSDVHEVKIIFAGNFYYTGVSEPQREVYDPLSLRKLTLLELG